MDVHAPHHPLLTWKDFFVHLGTITIGLLIALGLEAMVEAVHHRHMVREARAEIRREITENQAEARDDVKSLAENIGRIQQNLVTERQMRANPKNFKGHLSFTFSWSSLNESAWRTARDTGALTFMPPEEVQRYADLYGQQAIVTQQAVYAFTHEVEDAAPMMMQDDATPGAPEDIHELLHNTAVTYYRLATLIQLIQQLETQYGKTLKN